MSSVLSSSPVILSALLMTDAMDAPVLMGVAVGLETGVGAGVSIGLGAVLSDFAWACACGCAGGTAWGCAGLGGEAADLLSLRLKMLMTVPPVEYRAFQSS